MQADYLYPDKCKRNYKIITNALIKNVEEGALLRVDLANGLILAGLISVASESMIE